MKRILNYRQLDMVKKKLLSGQVKKELTVDNHILEYDDMLNFGREFYIRYKWKK